MKTTFKIMMCAASAVWWLAAPGRAVNVPLHFGLIEGAQDEHGQLLEGTAEAPGALVQVLNVTLGVFAPNADGTPHPDNPVLAEVRIGEGTDPLAGPLGLAAGSVQINRQQPVKLMARVFNRSSLEDASFYADSPVYTNSTAWYGMFVISSMRTDQPLDTEDNDRDGLVNSWERSLGTDPYQADSDGDGINDYQEMRAGTNPLDSGDVLQMVQVIPQANGTVVVKWDSVSGKRYRVQNATLDLMTPGAFEDVGPVHTAADAETMTIITNLPGVDRQHFRVLLAE